MITKILTESGRSILQHAREVVGDDKGVTTRLGNSPSVDAFTRLRVSNPAGLFDSQLQYDESLIFWESQYTGTMAAVTHLPYESAVSLTAGAGDRVTRQTREYHRYQPGKSQMIFATFVLAPVQQYVEQRIGYFDGDNGIYLEILDTDGQPYITRRTYTSGAAVDNRIAQADWNMDRLDGTGDSGISIDWTQSQILIIDLEWLGTGRVRVGFVIDGLIYYVHEFLNANRLNTVYMTTANLPVRYEIEVSQPATGTYSMKQICSMVASEGGFELERGIPMAVDMQATGTLSITTRRPILTIRPAATFNGIANRGTIVPEGYNIFSDDQDIYYEIIYGGFLNTSNFQAVNGTFSQVEYDFIATSISGGFVIDAGIVEVGSGPGQSRVPGRINEGLTSKLPLALDINGDHPGPILTDNLTVVVTSIPGDATDTAASLKWKELR